MNHYTKLQTELIAESMKSVFCEQKTPEQWVNLFDDLNYRVSRGEIHLPVGVAPWSALKGESLFYMMERVKGNLYTQARMLDASSETTVPAAIAELKEIVERHYKTPSNT